MVSFDHASLQHTQALRGVFAQTIQDGQSQSREERVRFLSAHQKSDPDNGWLRSAYIRALFALERADAMAEGKILLGALLEEEGIASHGPFAAMEVQACVAYAVMVLAHHDQIEEARALFTRTHARFGEGILHHALCAPFEEVLPRVDPDEEHVLGPPRDT